MARFTSFSPARVRSPETTSRASMPAVSRRAAVVLLAAITGWGKRSQWPIDGDLFPEVFRLSRPESSAVIEQRVAVSSDSGFRETPDTIASTPTLKTDGNIVFGQVPYPSVTDRLIPDADNANWNDAGPRRIKGVVFHRAEGGAWDVEEFLRSDQAAGLLDYMVESISGQIECWNDPFGREDRNLGVSANRASWANGDVNNPSGDAKLFLDDIGRDREALNRDQVSIHISGGFDDELGDACKQSVAALTAFFADQFNIAYYSFPMVPGKPYSFIRWHDQINANKICPGPAVKKAGDEIIDRARAILWQYQHEL